MATEARVFALRPLNASCTGGSSKRVWTSLHEFPTECTCGCAAKGGNDARENQRSDSLSDGHCGLHPWAHVDFGVIRKCSPEVRLASNRAVRARLKLRRSVSCCQRAGVWGIRFGEYRGNERGSSRRAYSCGFRQLLPFAMGHGSKHRNPGPADCGMAARRACRCGIRVQERERDQLLQLYMVVILVPEGSDGGDRHRQDSLLPFRFARPARREPMRRIELDHAVEHSRKRTGRHVRRCVWRQQCHRV